MFKQKEFGAIHCNNCGFIQGRQIIGGVMLRKGKIVKAVSCYYCKKKITLSVETVLFKSENPEKVSQWIKIYKQTLATEKLKQKT